LRAPYGLRPSVWRKLHGQDDKRGFSSKHGNSGIKRGTFANYVGGWRRLKQWYQIPFLVALSSTPGREKVSAAILGRRRRNEWF